MRHPSVSPKSRDLGYILGVAYAGYIEVGWMPNQLTPAYTADYSTDTSSVPACDTAGFTLDRYLTNDILEAKLPPASHLQSG